MNEENKVVDINEAQVEGNQSEEKKEDKVEVKHTVFAAIDEKIVARREAKLKKKAEKQPMNKGKKVAIIGGGITLGLGALGLGAKALLRAAANYAEDEENNGATETFDIPDSTETVSDVDTENEET